MLSYYYTINQKNKASTVLHFNAQLYSYISYISKGPSFNNTNF